MSTNVKKLEEYFLSTRNTVGITDSIGAEVETQFISSNGLPASLEQTQKLFSIFVDSSGWKVDTFRGQLITGVVSSHGTKIFYELGRHNLEVATIPYDNKENLILSLNGVLEQLYSRAYKCGIYPYFGPILQGNEDALVVPDERDKTWVKLDGRKVLNTLAYISSVQFTFSVSADKSIGILNKLNAHRDIFLEEFPQDEIWKEYIIDSSAGYEESRYGGPVFFEDMADYCRTLDEYKIVSGESLIQSKQMDNADISLFLRSIWWYFRLKRYGDTLCIEVRIFARKSDGQIEKQLDSILNIIN